MPDDPAAHTLLIALSGKVDALTDALEKSIHHTAGEFDKLWKHVEARDERLTNAISSIGERVANFGKPSVSAIVSVCVLIGSIGLAFIAPIKAELMRHDAAAEAFAKAMLGKDEKIQVLQSTLAVIENDQRWMRGEKRLRPADPAP